MNWSNITEEEQKEWAEVGKFHPAEDELSEEEIKQKADEIRRDTKRAQEAQN